MKVGIPKEITPGENRVSATPETVRKLCAAGLEVSVEQGAGLGAHYADEAYQDAGAMLVDTAQALGADIVFKVHKPTLGRDTPPATRRHADFIARHVS